MAKRETTDKDLVKVLRELRRQGFEVAPLRNHHLAVTKDGHRVAVLSATPSDRRSRKNEMADLRAAGFVWQGR